MKDKLNNALKDAVLCTSLVFTVFFFSPAEMYFLYKSEFIVGSDKILVPMLLLSLALSLCGFLFITAARRISKRLYAVVWCIGLGLLLSFYVQLLFLNGKMAIIGEDQTKALDDTRFLAINTVVYFLIFIIPSVIYIMASKKGEGSILKSISRAVMTFLPALLFFMQLTGLISSAVNASRIKHPLDYDRYFSFEPAVSLSKEGNVVVFLVDRLDSAWFETFLSDRPELAQTFDGFTYYANNVSNYTTTFPSVINMFTHSVYSYDGDVFGFIYDAWSKRCMLDELKDAGYESDLLVDRDSTYYDINNIADRCGNVYLTDKMLKINYGVIIKTMSDMSAGRVMPYLFKPLFLNKYDSSFSVSFLSYTDMPEDYMIKDVSSAGDVRFYKYLEKYGLNADAKNKKFIFTHFNGVHDASKEVSEISPYYTEGSQVDTESTAMGIFEILRRYFDQMKELGVYDNSTIIVIADHGRPPFELTIDDNTEISSPIMTMLAIKPAGAPRGVFTADAQSELSNIDFAASVLEYAGIKNDSYGMSYNDIIKNNVHRERTLQTQDVESGTDIRKTAKYSITGNARDFKNWKVINDD